MRAILVGAVVVLVGCGPMAPVSGRSEGTVEWTMGSDTETAEIAGGCLVTPGVSLAVGAGHAGGGVTVVMYGDPADLEWDGMPTEVETRANVGDALVRTDHTGCVAHVSTGHGVWIVTWSCDGVTGEAVVTACELAP